MLVGKHNIALGGVILVTICLLLQTYRVDLAMFYLFATCLFYYMLHRFIMHGIPNNPHVYVHHDKKMKINRCLELAIDFTFEIMACGTLLIFQYMYNIWVIPPSAVIFVVLGITLTHILNYSVFGSQIHRIHHEDTTKQFGPYFMDELFGTTDEKVPEDGVQHIPYFVMSGIITHFLKSYFQWKD